MEITHEEKVGFTTELHLFRRLPQDEQENVVSKLQQLDYKQGEAIYKQGAKGDRIYFIYSGQVQLTQIVNSKSVLTDLGEGDYFGEDALVLPRLRSASAAAATAASLFWMDIRVFEEMLHRIPTLKFNLKIAMTSRSRARSARLRFLNPGEVIYVMIRRHPFFLWLNLFLPVLAAAIGIASLVVGMKYLPASNGLTACGAVGVIALVGWFGWVILDWANDYYIVTSQRLIWLERVALIYDSRQEAPLSTLLSVNVETTMIGRILGYGDVIARTYTGLIRLERIGNCEVVASMIEEYWSRSKTTSHKEESEKMEEALRRRLNIPAEGASSPAGTPVASATVQVRPSFFSTIFAHFFQLRFEEGGVVTYRKHWFILVGRTWKPVFFFLIGLTVTIIRSYNYLEWIPASAFVGLMGLFLSGVILWYIYEYWDWRNDIYQVTADQILDIEKKPLGREQKNAAPIDNILSIEYERLGIIGLILNYGTVTINVGISQFTFNYVYNPSQVQQDLFRRMAERTAAKKRQEQETERERLSEWIAVYHRNYGDPRRRNTPPNLPS